MVDLGAVRLLVATLAGWLTGRQQELIAYLIDENRILRAQLGDRRVHGANSCTSTRRGVWRICGCHREIGSKP